MFSQDFITLFTSILVEAFPFVILGICVSILISNFKNNFLFNYIKEKNNFLSYILISLFGVFMPVCECGNIPVGRQLLRIGLKPSQVVTFLLAAPIVNPITLWSTLEAFNYDKSIAVIRIVSAFVISISIGLILNFEKDQSKFINKSFDMHKGSDHCHPKIISNKWIGKIDQFISEFFDIFKMMIIGAFIATLTQTLIPREIIVSIGSNPFLSILSMMILAFIISICSNVDAFFALSYSTSFTIGSILSFLIFGPMIDIKIISMLRSIFNTKLILTISVLVGLFSILIGLLVNLYK